MIKVDGVEFAAPIPVDDGTGGDGGVDGGDVADGGVVDGGEDGVDGGEDGARAARMLPTAARIGADDGIAEPVTDPVEETIA